MKLMPATETIALFDLLAPGGAELLARNAAGATPLQRFAAWAVSGRESRPYLEAVDRANFLRGCFPDLHAFETAASAARLVTHARLLSDCIIKACSNISFGGINARLHVWESIDPPDLNVLVLVYGSLLPWCIHKSAIDAVAQMICRRHRVRFLMLKTEDLPASSSISLSKYNERLSVFLQRLPVSGPFVLLCSGGGLATPMMWSLRPRLVGALLLNVSMFREGAFQGSGAEEEERARSQRFFGYARSQRGDLITHAILSDVAFAHCAEDMLSMEKHLTVAYNGASLNFWNFVQRPLMHWTAAELSKNLRALPPVKVPNTIIACGALADTETVHRSSLRLQRLLPGASMAYIQESRAAWELEGAEQQRSVAGLLHGLLLEVAAHLPEPATPAADVEAVVPPACERRTEASDEEGSDCSVSWEV